MTGYDPQAHPYREIRVGALEHLTYATSAMERDARTFCGMWLAGTPVSPRSLGPCNECLRLAPCDECGHAGPEHLWAPALEADGKAEAARYVYDHATCWAENVCQGCSPALHSDVLARALGTVPDAPAGAGDSVEAYRG